MFFSLHSQMQHRLASEELPKSSGLRKVRLTTLIESLQAQFGLARSLVALVVQNFDFAHLTIVGDVTSGPYGQANVKVCLLLLLLEWNTSCCCSCIISKHTCRAPNMLDLSCSILCLIVVPCHYPVVHSFSFYYISFYYYYIYDRWRSCWRRCRCP